MPVPSYGFDAVRALRPDRLPRRGRVQVEAGLHSANIDGQLASSTAWRLAGIG
jgi:hypothetical protein